jgi:hypothetical protein
MNSLATHQELEGSTCDSTRRVFNFGVGRATAARIVWSVWAVLVVAAVGYVIHFGSNVPYWDDWNMVDVITGAQPVTLQWLWSPYGGHRLPLPRLILFGLYKLSGGDFRVGMYFNVAVLAAVAAALIWASGRMRGGRTSVADAIFPLLLLHWGHFENLLWSWQLGFGLAVALTCAALAVIAAYGLAPVPKAGVVLAALGIVILPISDVPGMVYAPALACWVAATGMVAYRDHRRGYAVLLWAAAMLALTLVILYFRGYPHNDVPLVPRSVAHWRALFRTSVRFVAGGLGPTVQELLPAARGVAAMLPLAAAAALGWAALRRDRSPHRALGLLLFFAGAACLVATFAAGRLNAGFQSRYFALAAPIWCAAFLAWRLCLGSVVARWAELGLLAAVLIATPLNYRAGLRYARNYHERMERFHTDMLAGMTPAELVARHVGSLYPFPWWGYLDVGVQVDRVERTGSGDGFPIMEAVSFHERIEGNLRKLRRAKIGDYARMRPNDPPVRDVVPSSASGFTIDRASGDSATAASEDRAILLTPAQPLYVAGVRVRRPGNCASSSASDPSPQWVQVFWRLAGEPAYTAPHRYVFVWDSGKDEEIVWIFKTIDQIAFHIGDPDVQRRLNADDLPVTVLLPVESTSAL